MGIIGWIVLGLLAGAIIAGLIAIAGSLLLLLIYRMAVGGRARSSD